MPGLPPGPAMPVPLQTLAMLTRQRPFLERQRRRFGNVFSIKMAGGLSTLVPVADPDLVKQVFQAPADQLHAGTRSPLRPVLGDNSLLGIDEDRHLEQRRLLLPPFKGSRVQAYAPLIEEIAEAELARLPEGVELATGPVMQRITLRAILRAVFGAEGAALARLEALMPEVTDRGQALSRWPQLHRDLGPRSPWGRFLRLRAEVDRELDGLIERARRDEALAGRTDVLALLVQATHTDGSPMANAEIRDQLVTMLAAGHETTAHTLSWAVERLTRHPEVLAALVEEADAGGSALREATVREVQRTRPVISFAGRFVMRPYELGEWTLPRGVVVGLSAGLTHYDPGLFPEPHRFRPERFLQTPPGTYSWIPFGGGVRRCIGATFAHLELDVVLRVLLQRLELRPTTAPPERWRFKGVAWVPADGGRVVVRHRRQEVRGGHRPVALAA